MKRTKKIALIMLAVALMAACFVLEMNASSTDEELIEYKEGCYTYTVKNGEATLVEVDDDVSGHLVVPET
ncbi:MAG: hypothetical protein II356_00810, partial [Clostridia bacterium]|nr:hypothetical protein [Clostridia bacterium]